MSVLISALSTGLSASTNLSNPQSCTKLVWAQCAGAVAGTQTLLDTTNGARTSFSQLFGGAGSIDIGTAGGVFNGFASTPVWTNWNCYAMTATTAGAGSLIGYFQDDAGGGFVSQSITGVAFTNANDLVAAGSLNQAITMAFYMEWNVVLTPTQLATQFLSATPNVLFANVSRYCIMANAATAGNDTSGNGFNMSVVGVLSDGVGLPTFPNNAAIAWVT